MHFALVRPVRELKLWYRDRLPDRISALEATRGNLERGEAEALDSLRRLAHALRGSGATYGFPEISEAAKRVEEASEEETLPSVSDLLRTLKGAVASGDVDRRSILIIEDDADLAAFAQAALAAPGLDFHMARSAAEARAVLDEKEVSLILLDLVLPDSDGRNLLLEFRERLATSVIPVVVTTGKTSAQVRAECLALGADEFLEKPFSAAALKEAVEARLGAGSELTREFRRDPLTGLANRAAFHEAFERARYVAAVAEEPLAVALIDLDRFRQVNELCGTETGDQVLRQTAALLARSLRGSDFIARWGGEEFVVFFPKTSSDDASAALRKTLQDLHDEPISAGAGRSVKLTFSAGVADVRDGMGLQDALAEADRLLSVAKHTGLDRVISIGDRVEAPRRRVLIVEDDELIRMVVKRLLEQEGLEVDAAADGVEALERALERPYSLVVSDIQMPRMDGLELLTRLRLLPPTAQTPVVMLTAMGSEEDVVRGIERGADEYIVKPFASAELRARVRRLLKKGVS